ncbi:hypothetical protein FRC02_004039 [Tulasnella sp. 418]|nr:hypothetical protein FRC02_004039 [Tulasnella sp. 418]
MVFVDRTNELKELTLKYPEAKRRKLDGPRKGDEKSLDQVAAQAYLQEAYSIIRHITALTSFLATIRRAYLNVDSTSSYTRQARNIDFAAASSGKLDAFAGIKSLTNEERDQIDLQAKLILSKCADRVKEMELLEKRRMEASAAKSNPLLRLLPTRLTASDAVVHAEFIAAHRSNITWYLTRRLADTSQVQKEMQEERIKRQMERARTLGSTAAPSDLPTLGSPAQNTKSSPATGFAAFTGTFMPRGSQPTSNPAIQNFESESDLSDAEDLELTPAQIQLFEEENAALLRTVEDTLQSVQLAESRLLDISALQTELVVQLARQTEVVEQLYDEAITTQGEVEKGHGQLKQAKERAKESRKWILVFILGATMAMLFLHWYD